MDYSFGVGRESLPQVKKFKYPGVLFTSEGKTDHKIDSRNAGVVLDCFSKEGAER